MRLEDAIRLAAGSAMRQLASNLAEARRGDVEGVHRMRVALRRLRTVLVLFSPFIEKRAKARFNEAIRNLGQILGTARDWDVFVLQTLKDAKRAGIAKEGLPILRRTAEERRAKAHAKVHRVLVGTAPARLVGGMEAWIAKGEYCAPAHAHMPLVEVLPELIERIASKVHRRGRDLAKLSPEGLHLLRKSIKKLRYSVESCGKVYTRKRVLQTARTCKKLQSLLGAVNDSTVAVRLLTEIAKEPSADLKPAVAELLAWNEVRRNAAHAKLAKIWHEFKAEKPFRR